MELATLARDWGWLLAVTLYFLPKLWTFWADRFWPARIREREKTAQAIRDADATILKARIEREEREADQRLRLEERTVTAIEQIQTTAATIQQLLITVQTQLTNHNTMAFNGIQDLKGGIEKLQDLEGIKKRQEKLEHEMRIITQPGMKKAKP